MKKVICLILVILFLTTGCYDYIELNELAIVSGISIDYDKDEYKVAFEILNTKNQDQSPDKNKVYIAKGKGKNIADAFYNTSLEIAKTPYLAHLKTVIISEEIAKNHVEDIVDFLIRDNYIRNIFYLVMAKDNEAYEILKKTDTNNPVVSTAIKELIDSTGYTNNMASTLNFEKFVTDIIDSKKDAYISSIEIKNDILKLGPLAVFSGYNMQTYLTENESATFNILNNTSKENSFTLKCPNDENKNIIVSTYDKGKSKIAVTEKTATIRAEIETRIVENHCDMDFKAQETYEKLQNQLEKKLKKEMQEVTEKLIQYNSDALKINELYYQKYKKEIDFRSLQYKYEAKALINRNGLIFEVKQ